MTDILFRLILGHLIGDYLLQNNWMALNKKDKKQIGPIWVHCWLYTLAVKVCLLPELLKVGWQQMIVIDITIFLSHYVFDRFEIVDWWLEKYGGRSYKSVARYMQMDVSDIYKQGYVAYTAIVQTVADNTLHLITMYLIIKFILRV